MWFLRSRLMDRLAETRLRAELCAPPPSAVSPTGSLDAQRGPPVVQPVEGPGGRYRLVETFVPDLPPAVTHWLSLQVPADPSPSAAYFNGASVPWQAWWFLRPMEPRVVAGALVHDMLYVQRGELCGAGGRVVVSRNFSDLVFFVLMVRSRLQPYRAWVAFVAVRTFSRSLFLRGAPPPEPCEVGRKAEAALARTAWEFLTDHRHQGSWIRLAAILTTFLGAGGWVGCTTWAARSGSTAVATGLTLTMAAALVLTASWVAVASVWCVRSLARQAAAGPPAGDGR